MKKKILSLVMAATVVFTGTAFAQTAETEVLEPQVISAVENYPLAGYVTVSEIGDDYIIGSTEENGDIRLNVSEETIIVNSELQSASSLKDIKEGEEIYAEYSPNMTRSIPPQSNAYMIVSGSKKGGNVNIIKVDEMGENENGTIFVKDNTKDIIVTVSKDAKVRPYKTKNIVTVQDITVGSTLLMWYDYMTLSIPAYTNTNKVIIVNSPDYKLVVNGEIIADAQAPYYDETTLMVPLRKIGEALGYEIGWNEESESITVEDGKSVKATLVSGSREVTFETVSRALERNRKVINAKETVIIDGSTFVPLEFFGEFSNETSLEGGIITITPVVEE